jgi:undecaprenyl-diphosphatase
MDYAAFRLLNGLAGHSAGLDRLAMLVAQYGAWAFAGVLLWLWGLRPDAPGKLADRTAAARGAVGSALALATGQVVIRIFPRPRPFAAHAVRLLIPPSPDPSFPSDHALAAFAIATAVAWTRPRLGWGLAVAATLLGVARVFVGAHYPGDVLAGALLGSGIGVLARKLDAWIEPAVALASRASDAVWRRRR